MNIGKLFGICLKPFSCLLLLLICISASAQTGASAIRGTIQDQQGAAVAGATVNLTNADKNFSRTQPTNEEGAYAFTAVPPGTYRIEVKAQGFKSVSVSDIQALVDTAAAVDLKLEVGN